MRDGFSQPRCAVWARLARPAVSQQHSEGLARIHASGASKGGRPDAVVIGFRRAASPRAQLRNAALVVAGSIKKEASALATATATNSVEISGGRAAIPNAPDRK